MTSPQPFSVVIRHPDGDRVYTLYSKDIQLRGNKVQRIYFFARSGAAPGLEYEVVENVSPELPLEMQVRVARALVNLQDYTKDDAAKITARLKADVERLSDEQKREVQEQIRLALDAPE